MNKKYISILGLTITLACAGLSSQSFAANYYKWVDAKGTTHYTKTPPPRNAQSRKQVETYGWTNSAPTPARATTENTEQQTQSTTNNAPAAAQNPTAQNQPAADNAEAK
jgi:squalene cyclase